MSTNEAEALEAQRRRRRRINRIKTGIILTIAIWMIASLLAIVILSVQMVRLNHKIGKITEAISNSIQDTPSETESEDKDSGVQEQTPAVPDNSNVVTGIDTPDNMAKEGDEHLVYLTFDSSPGSNTLELLDQLKQYDVKATFFVVGDDSEEMREVYRQIVLDGHTLGMHSYSNLYSNIYASVDAFYQDYQKISGLLEDTTGEKSKYYRFPGGSSNEISNVNMTEFVRVLNENGVIYFDWNVSAGDASAEYSVADIVSNVTEGVSKYKTSVVLLHDGANKSTTAEAIGPLVEALRDMNVKILPIDENTNVIQYIKAASVE